MQTVIPIALYLAFVLASIVLLIIPGPNVALICSTSLAQGSRAGLATVVGTSCAMALQLAMSVAGMTALITISASWFSALRWIGVFYLLYLGIRAWHAAPTDLIAAPPAKPRRVIFWRGAFISLTNPKTLLFFGAFLPQFVSPASPPLPQLLVLSATFFVLAVIMDSAWALLAGRLRIFLRPNGRLHNRLHAGLLIGAAAGLALARKS